MLLITFFVDSFNWSSKWDILHLAPHGMKRKCRWKWQWFSSNDIQPLAVHEQTIKATISGHSSTPLSCFYNWQLLITSLRVAANLTWAFMISSGFRHCFFPWPPPLLLAAASQRSKVVVEVLSWDFYRAVRPAAPGPGTDRSPTDQSQTAGK